MSDIRLSEILSPTQRDYASYEGLEAWLMGPRGEGKTEASIARMCSVCAKQPEESLPIPWAIIRDTWTNLERTTLRSFISPDPDSFAAKIRPHLKVSNGGQRLELPGYFTADLFGMDSLGDLNRLQSLQLGGLWIEEPAPAAAEDIGGGLEERVITVGISSLRHRQAFHTVQVSSNYPDEDHWSWIRANEKVPGRRLFRIPRGENQHLPADYRQNMERALANDTGLLQRLVLGQPGFVVQGEPVTPEYDPDVHRAKVQLDPYPGIVGYRFWDGGLNPTAVLAQLTPRGYLHVFHTLVGVNIGVRQLIHDHLKPLLKDRYTEIPEWTDIGDPAMCTREQSDSSQTAAYIIQRELATSFRPGPVSWDTRRNSIKSALLRRVDGQPFLLLSPTEAKLHRALRGGWRYKKDTSGRILTDKPVKDIHSHPADALSYGLSWLLYLADEKMVDPYPRRRYDSRPARQRGTWMSL